VNASNILETEIRERQSIHEKERVKKTRKRKEEKKKQEIFLRQRESKQRGSHSSIPEPHR